MYYIVLADKYRNTVYREIFSPSYFCPFHPPCQKANFKLGEFHTWFLNYCLNKKEYLSYIPLFEQIQYGAGVKGRKKSGAKITFYTVWYIIKNVTYQLPLWPLQYLWDSLTLTSAAPRTLSFCTNSPVPPVFVPGYLWFLLSQAAVETLILSYAPPKSQLKSWTYNG